MPYFSTLEDSPDDPEPQWRGPTLTGIFAGIVLITLIAPDWFGRPINTRSVKLYCVAEFHGDSSVDRAVTVLRKVYSSDSFEVVEKPPDDPGCGRDGARIDLVRNPIPGPAYSWIYNGCRYTGINPDDPNFTSRTLAHEFGHQNFGDVGLSFGPFNILFNMVFDMRNDLIINFAL